MSVDCGAVPSVVFKLIDLKSNEMEKDKGRWLVKEIIAVEGERKRGR